MDRTVVAMVFRNRREERTLQMTDNEFTVVVTIKVRAESQAKAETLISDTIAFDMDNTEEVVEWST